LEGWLGVIRANLVYPIGFLTFPQKKGFLGVKKTLRVKRFLPSFLFPIYLFSFNFLVLNQIFPLGLNIWGEGLWVKRKTPLGDLGNWKALKEGPKKGL